MKERLTRHKDEFPCRLKGHCSAEEWMLDVTDTIYLYWRKYLCGGTDNGEKVLSLWQEKSVCADI